MFTALKHRDFRIYWVGGLVSFTGAWVQSVADSWLVYDITGSKFWLGLIGFASTIPLLGLSLFAGTIADRVDKRKALLVTQGLFSIFALTLGLLVYTGNITKYHILVIALMQGTVMSLDAPIRQSMPAELVPKSSLTNAIILNSVSFNLARIVGPALGGILIAAVGMAWCFFVNAASFIAVIIAVLFIRTDCSVDNDKNASIIEDLTNGIKYVRSKPQILKVMLAASIATVFVLPYLTLMPIFARDILKVGPSGNGLLFTSVGVGAVLGAAGLIKFMTERNSGRITAVAGVMCALFLAVFANSSRYTLSRVILIGVGAGFAAFNQTNNSLIQHSTSDEFRGRVMSAYIFVSMGFSPFGSLQAGFFAEKIGAPMTLSIGAFLFLATSVFLLTQKDIMRPKRSVL